MKMIKNGSINIEYIEKIRIVIIDNYLYTLDNRRLYMFQQLNLKKIPIIIIRKNDVLHNLNMKLSNALYYKNGNLYKNYDWTKIHNVLNESYPGYYDIVY
jgi:hypothetical protein